MNTLKGKKILVTGGTGFVGSHLVKALIEQGAHVVTTFLQLDPLSYFMTEELDKKTVMERIDLVDFDRVFDLVTKHEVEYIFHLAAQPLVDVAYYNPRRTLESNINGTINILESARLYPKVKGILVASSDKAYGKHGEIKYKETDALKGDHPYEVSKSAADLICTSYAKTYDLPVVITRFGNIYGEGDLNFSRIIPGIMRSLITKETLELRSDGTFVRDYLYVKDVVDGYIRLAENIENAKGKAYNFGSDDTLSVLELIDTIEKSLKTKISYDILNTAKNEIPYQSLDYSKIRKEFNWKPEYSVKNTAQSIKKWYVGVFG
ncbi:GDP-mannose 4,6-dehydratase [Candidatus Roizmanbacteria bacterium]|nr:MAG: GDP-mannose 4,6-dehydratase [Candidatus Roizmanbacteria bacterium]